jgi:broad specificity phosphatase PhoE
LGIIHFFSTNFDWIALTPGYYIMQNDINFELFLIRHGESEVNASPDEMGQSPDVKLTELGIQQAKKLTIKYAGKFDIIYASPYKRALDTAIISMDSSKIIVADELREYDAGDWLGASRKETLTPEVRQQMGYFNHFFLPPNGESMYEVEHRVSKWFEDTILYNHSINNKGLKIACFSHGMTIKTLLHHIIGFDKSLTWRISIDNTSVTHLYCDNRGFGINCINNTSHL